MRLNELFPSKWLAAGDLDSETNFTISHVTRERVGDDQRAVVHFREKPSKPLVLNKTNATTIARIVGTDDTDDWPGRAIVVFPTTTEMAGETVACIRVKAPRPQGGDRARAPQRPDHQAPLDNAPPPPAHPGDWERDPF